MSFAKDLEAKFESLKTTVEGDLHAVVLKLEAIFNRVHLAEVSSGLKQAVSSDIDTVLHHVTVVADNVRVKADLADKVVDAADDTVDAEASKTTSSRRR